MLRVYTVFCNPTSLCSTATGAGLHGLSFPGLSGSTQHVASRSVGSAPTPRRLNNFMSCPWVTAQPFRPHSCQVPPAQPPQTPSLRPSAIVQTTYHAVEACASSACHLAKSSAFCCSRCCALTAEIPHCLLDACGDKQRVLLLLSAGTPGCTSAARGTRKAMPCGCHTPGHQSRRWACSLLRRCRPRSYRRPGPSRMRAWCPWRT